MIAIYNNRGMAYNTFTIIYCLTKESSTGIFDNFFISSYCLGQNYSSSNSIKSSSSSKLLFSIESISFAIFSISS